jgi:hypothetical protein
MITLKKVLIILFLLFPSFNILYAGTIDPNISDQKYLNFGNKFYCVVKLCGTYKDNQKFCGSGVIIDENFLLTAAHVVKDYKTCYIKIKDKEYILDKVVIHEDFEKNFGVADIAIGYHKNGFGLEYYPPLYTKNDEENKIVAIAGWGLTGDFNKGVHLSDDKLRAGSNTIDYISRDLLICSPSHFRNPDHTSLEYLICSGDSGGGLFINGKLAGINSCVMAVGRSPQSKYGDESGHTRVSKFIDWINLSKEKIISDVK